MKKHKVIIFAAVLAVITVIAAVIHLNTRGTVAEGTLLLSVGDKEIILDTSDFLYEQVTGVRVNGKGEEIEVDAPGVSIKRLLDSTEIPSYEKLNIVSNDSYRAEISAEEVEDGTMAFLILDEEKKFRLVVFGDTNSKRSVSNVVQIVVE